jgi:putative photosynthetic complex assembly protein
MSTGFNDARASAAEPAEGMSRQSPIFSRRLIIAMALMCVAALGLAGFGRLTGVGVQKLPSAPVAEERTLRFLDAGGGAIVIEDGADGKLVQRVAPGEGSFIRTVMRGMAHDRMARGGDSSTPFRLVHRTDGWLILADPMTGREVILNSFGKPNSDLFLRLLPGAPTTSLKAAGAVPNLGGTNK